MISLQNLLLWSTIFLTTEPHHDHTESHTQVHGSWFGVGDGTVIMWSLVWVLLPIGLFAIIGLIWAGKTGHFRDVQQIAEKQLELED
ncbi:MAG: hypothetical protein HC939_04080 [Pleurocapsa sp. SU_5_0]|nr:hypothetical protein [Pleurocapsa sp. SU_5_0]NJO96483.1 hypothetical protein [Pleurocapsa sp. CRU_1_2]NJR44393.1 hypothetical protein [Hyellaceae cyanobacterium CSU_1_1]